MKKGVMVLLLVGMLLVLPLVQAQTYSGFDRFADGVRLFFSGGDNKVKVALEIKEKEINSAMENIQNGDDDEANVNLERAWNRLQLVQEKVTENTAEEVKQSSNNVREQIRNQENLSTDFEVYSLEEEKTGLTAEWVIEVNGKEGQTLEREVEVTVAKGDGGNRTVEIENRIGEIDNEISKWVVEHTYAEGTSEGGESGVFVEGGLARVVKTEIANGDNGLKREVKTYVEVAKGKNEIKNSMKKDNEDVKPAPNVVDDGVDPGPEGIVGQGSNSQDTHNVAAGDGGEGDYADGTTADGVDAGDSSSDSDGGNSVDGGEISSGGDSGSSDSGGESSDSSSGGEGGITGEVIRDSNSDNLLKRLSNWLF